MTSIAGRPYNVGFDFRIIAASISYYVTIASIKEYNYNSNFDLVNTTELLASPNLQIERGNFTDYTAGRNKDLFTIVYVTCASYWGSLTGGCMVYQLISFSLRKAVSFSLLSPVVSDVD